MGGVPRADPGPVWDGIQQHPHAPLPLLSLHLGLTHFSLTTQHLWPFRRVLCMTTDARGYSCPPSEPSEARTVAPGVPSLSRGPSPRGCCGVQLDRTGWQYVLSASEQPQAHRTLLPPSFSRRCRCRDTDLECVWICVKHTNTHTHPFFLFDICSLPSQTASQRLGWCCPAPTPKGWSSVMFLEGIHCKVRLLYRSFWAHPPQHSSIF